MWQVLFLWVIVAPIAMVALVAGKKVSASTSSIVQIVAATYVAIYVWRHQSATSQKVLHSLQLNIENAFLLKFWSQQFPVNNGRIYCQPKSSINSPKR